MSKQIAADQTRNYSLRAIELPTPPQSVYGFLSRNKNTEPPTTAVVKTRNLFCRLLPIVLAVAPSLHAQTLRLTGERNGQPWVTTLAAESTELKLDHQGLTALTLPAELPNLQTLWLHHNQLTELILPALPNLQELDLYNNQLRELTLPAELSNLQTLSLGGNPLKSLAVPAGWNLDRLQLSGFAKERVIRYRPNSLLPDIGLQAAVRAALRKGETEAITADDLAGLTALNARWTEQSNRPKIRSLAGLEPAVNLETLDLRDNALTSPTLPTAWTKLREQNLAGNPLNRADDLRDTPGIWARLRGMLGLLLLAFSAWALSSNRRNIPWRVVLWGIALQIVFAVLILRTPVGAGIFDVANQAILAVVGFTLEGARFLFGDLVYNTVPVGTGTAGDPGLAEGSQYVARTGAFVAFNVLPTIIFFASLMTVLYHLGLMQWLVRGIAWIMWRTMRTSGAETLSAAGNIFVGQTEAPLLVKPFVNGMTRSELMAIMTGGFATVAGGVMAAYAGMLVGFFPDIAGHLMAASVMSAPAALVVAKLMVPEEEKSETASGMRTKVERPDVNVIEAAARGAGEGLRLAANVGGMLLAFLALIALVNGLLGWAGGLVGLSGLSLEGILGVLLAPVAWVMGVPWQDAAEVGSLMGLKTVATEFVAYLGLADGMSAGTISDRSAAIAAYALSGFANFSSIAIQIGGIGGIAPKRRQDLARLGLRAMIGGSIAAFMTAAIAGVLI